VTPIVTVSVAALVILGNFLPVDVFLMTATMKALCRLQLNAWRLAKLAHHSLFVMLALVITTFVMIADVIVPVYPPLIRIILLGHAKTVLLLVLCAGMLPITCD